MNYNETVTAVNQVIAQYQMPLTLRQIYYRLVAAGLIPNRRSAYNGLSAQLVKAREAGEVDERRIVDRSRSIEDHAYDSPNDFLEACEWTMKNRFVRRYWSTQETYVEAWVEKDALSQVIAGAVEELNTIVAPSRGYSSFSYVRDAVRRFQKNRGEAERVVILHLTDHDPSGLDMSRDLRARFNAYSAGFLFNVELKRVALTIEQVRQYDLIPNPTKITDPRAAGYMAQYGDECWELDAIEPPELVRLIHEAAESEVTDWEAWNEIKTQDEEERDGLLEVIVELKDKYQ
ncbi:hypothetical protein ES703_25814 [subsurface metagenome]